MVAWGRALPTLAEDEAGRSLLGPHPTRIEMPSVYTRPRFLLEAGLSAGLAAPAPGATRLRRVRGVVPVVLQIDGPPLLVAEGVAAAEGRNFLGEDGVTLKVRRVRRQGASCTVEVLVRNLAPSYVPALYRWELRDDKGEVFNDGAFTLRRTAEGLEGQIDFRSPRPAGAPARLTLYPVLRARTEVPFEFRDLPLP